MSTIKLALIRQKYRPDGGAERFLARAIEALKDDIELTIFTRKWQQQDGVNIVECNPAKWSRVSREKGFAKEVCKKIQKHKFDLIQSHERVPYCDVYRAGDGVHREWLKQRDRVISPAARAITKITPFHKYALKAEESLYNSDQLRAIICNSQMVAEEIKTYFPKAADKTHVIYSGINYSVFNPGLEQHRGKVRSELNITQDQNVFLYVGSGFERKGLATAIKAIAKIDNAILIVIGKDRHSKKYQQLADDLQTSDKIRFLGVKKDVTPYYGCADAFVFPTLYDPFPNVVIEALASGLPVITSTKCGAAEIIEQGKDGFVCDALDTKSISDFMRQLQDPQTLVQMSAAAHEKSKIFSTEEMSFRLTKLYTKLLDTKQPGKK
ncbi:MAG: glycosyltransferase family 1 protein [Gammaproteobacteria bacterium]|nr:MAG: glycosyltransferase family 1 protein [Gammaproteobacteria bacterium]